MNKAVQASTIETLMNSIIYDGQVYFWFSLFIRNSRVRQHVVSRNPWAAGRYALDQRLMHGRSGLALCMLVFLLLLFFTGHNFYIVFFLLSVCGLFLCARQQKKIILDLSRTCLEEDYMSAEVMTRTLYQIAERYSRIYHLPSMVDVIYRWDYLSRRLFAVAAVVLIAGFGLLGVEGFIIAWVVVGVFFNLLVRLTCIYQKQGK